MAPTSSFLAALALCSIFLSSWAVDDSDSTISSPLGPVVDLGYAAYAGNLTTPIGQPDDSVVFFGGIRYAQSPTGNLRFRGPQKLNESVHDGAQVVDARSLSLPCFQQPAANAAGTEDCLRLNVWKPKKATSKSKLPVAVYIYGGGFYAGSTQSYPMDEWVSAHPTGIIAVSISYRLNTLGFLAGAAVHEDGDFNAGILDQRAALEWVQRHIDKFGGDPRQVTIIGESAGGASVAHQVVAYGGAQGAPFQRAIAQSIEYGSLIDPFSLRAETAFHTFSAAIGCNKTQSDKDALACLRQASTEDMVTGINSLKIGDTVPVLDGTFFPDFPSHLISEGHFSEVDFIGGHCTNDGTIFAGGQPGDYVTDVDVVDHVFPAWPYVTIATIDKVLDFYHKLNASGTAVPTEWDLAWTIAQDTVYGCMDQHLANHMLAKGKKNVFTFRWNAPNPAAFAVSPWNGVSHGSDTYFLFPGTKTYNASAALLSKQAIAYWTSFVISGNPSAERAAGSPAWQPFTGSDGSSRSRIVPTLGNGNVTGIVLEHIPEFEVDRCAFWMQDWVTDQTRV